MKEPQDRAFEGRSGFQEAVLAVLALARREIWLLDPGFADCQSMTPPGPAPCRARWRAAHG